MIPEISIPYHGRHLGILRGGGVSWTGIPKTWGGGGVTQFGIPKAWGGGCFSSEFSEFPEERRRKLRLKSLTC